MTPIRNMRELVERASALGPCRVAVPGADSKTALGAALEGEARGLVEPVLIGDRAAIVTALESYGADPARYPVVDEPDLDRAARRAVALVRGEGAEIVLKGSLSTAQLLRAVLDRDHGLRGPGLLSDVLVTEAPGGEPRLLGVTDGGLNVAPSLEDKRRILENAVRVFHRLGVERPKVALLCAIETVTPAMPHTAEAAALQALAERGELEGCEPFGPVALDGALSVGAARAKGMSHPAAGKADVILVPNIETGNALGKSFTWLAEKRVGHVVEGARAPVLIPSRAEGSMDKLCSLALGVLVARGGR
ncbi:phosphate acyltransferase [Anaeromyxobacter paludicola]|uniref:Phosphate butyryltransferase n=1 Tax=Anaeromyxobacter paludicola TaxID=2918171 RepID=A0ABM7XD92_9BACT|nr:phosphate acyltransferase [Anaeromyxobacter paludicola]BDG09846.1 phosphate butyryltransferase [Anaeromyxobacter paludicola]